MIIQEAGTGHRLFRMIIQIIQVCKHSRRKKKGGILNPSFEWLPQPT